ncbi:hypothetical protein Efla_005982 [Eimeria flavescens]
MWAAALEARDLALRQPESPKPVGSSATACSSAAVPSHGQQQQQQVQQLLLQQQQRDEELLVLPRTGEESNSLWITPVPLYTAKTKLADGRKLFLNFCGHHQIESWHTKEVLLKDEQQEGQPLPQATLTPPGVETTDKEGTPCLACDLVLNLGRAPRMHAGLPSAAANTLKRCWEDKEARSFLGSFARAAVSQKHGLQLQEGVSFPKLKYKGSLPPAPQRIRLTREAHIQPLSPAAAAPAAAAGGAAAGAGGGEDEVSLAAAIEWQGWFVSPPDTAAFWRSLTAAQDGHSEDRQQQQQQQSSSSSSSHSKLVPWLIAWASSSSSSEQRFIPVEALHASKAETLGSSPPSAKALRREGLKRAFFLAEPAAVAAAAAEPSPEETLEGSVYVLQCVLPRAAAAASSSSSRCPGCQQQRRRCRCGKTELLDWEFRCTYTVKVSDFELVLSPLRGSLFGIKKKAPGPIRGCSIAFPFRLLSRAAIAAAVACSSCEEARRQLLQQTGPWAEDTLKPPAAAAAAAATSCPDTPSAAFLLTICVPADRIAEAALASLLPHAANAAAAAAAEEAAAGAAAAENQDAADATKVQAAAAAAAEGAAAETTALLTDLDSSHKRRTSSESSKRDSSPSLLAAAAPIASSSSSSSNGCCCPAADTISCSTPLPATAAAAGVMSPAAAEAAGIVSGALSPDPRPGRDGGPPSTCWGAPVDDLL